MESLDLSHNMLRALPTEFVLLARRLKFVNLEKNPWTDLPARWNTRCADRPPLACFKARRTHTHVPALALRVSRGGAFGRWHSCCGGWAAGAGGLTLFLTWGTTARLRWTAKEQQWSYSGYTGAEALHWTKDAHTYYWACCDEWDETGVLHYTLRATLDDFIRVRGEALCTWL
jgi:hypothetical protein